jgi:hypothetical protein
MDYLRIDVATLSLFDGRRINLGSLQRLDHLSELSFFFLRLGALSLHLFILKEQFLLEECERLVVFVAAVADLCVLLSFL